MNMVYDSVEDSLEEKYESEKKDREKLEKLLVKKQQELLKTEIKLQNLIEQQAKGYLDINRALEKKIKEEVERSRKKDNMMFQQAKMVAMGEMIGNIAHQWRQPLNVISTGASGLMIEREFGLLTDQVLDSTLQQIVDCTQKLSQTIENFKNFFKTDKQKNNFTIHIAILDTIDLMKDSFNHHNIKVIQDFKKIDIYGLRSEFTHAMMNILHNSKEFLIKRSLYKNRLIFITNTAVDDQLIIKFRDNAGGIEEEIIDRIFEPYFTTKHKSQGIGLGLYMTQVIIQKHMNGAIEVENVEYEHEARIYKGAEFTITFPLAEKSQ